MKKRMLVIGVGSAGILTLGQMLEGLPDDWEIHSVYDPKIPILGVGEATSTLAPNALFKGTDFIVARDSEYLDSTVKFSVKYTNWRKHSFHSWIVPQAYALHFDNTRLKDFAFMRFKERHPTKFVIHEGTVDYFKNIENAVEVSINQQVSIYDYIIDCSGFPKDYKGYTMIDLPLNSALVTSIQKPGDYNYTHHWAHKNGWMFGIPLQSRQGWGYMYNNDITSKDDAIVDMCDILKLNPQNTKFREYSFNPYYATDNLIDGRILKNGNRFMFFEPMEAMSMEYYTTLNMRYLLLLNEKVSKKTLLKHTREDIESLIMFYRFIYHGGSIYDTEFWQITKEKTSYYLKNTPQFQTAIDYWKKNHSEIKRHGGNMIIAPFDIYIWQNFDRELGYNYFTK
jgi:Tryptophan halogenase